MVPAARVRPVQITGSPDASSLSAGLPLPLIRRAEILAGFVHRALGIVIGLDGLAVFVHCAVALAGIVKDLAQLNVAPYLSPARLAVSVDGLAVFVGGRLVVALQVKDI